MGYRSEVAVVIYGDKRDQEKYEALKTLMNTAFKDVYTEFEANAMWHDRKGVLEFRMHDVKWYDSYSDVIAFNAMLGEIEGLGGYTSEFLRVGEDADDIESVCRGEDVEYILGVSRTIEVNL